MHDRLMLVQNQTVVEIDYSQSTDQRLEGISKILSFKIASKLGANFSLSV